MMKNPGILRQVCTVPLICQCQCTAGVQLEKHYLHLSTSTEIKFVRQCISLRNSPLFIMLNKNGAKYAYNAVRHIHEVAVK